MPPSPVRIERDTEAPVSYGDAVPENPAGTPIVRVAIDFDDLQQGEQFRSKWRYDLGEPDDVLAVKAFAEYGNQLSLRVSRMKSGTQAESIANGVARDAAVRRAARLVADFLRPAGRPEVVASCRNAADNTREYRVVPDGLFKTHDDGTITPTWAVVYDVAAEAVFACVHEQGLESYDAAAARAGVLVWQLPHSDEKVYHDDVTLLAAEEARKDKEALEWAQKEGARLEREREEHARQAEWEARGRIEAKFGDVKGKRATVEIPLCDDDGQPTERRVPATGTVVGWFIVHRWPDDDDYTLTHRGTGQKCGKKRFRTQKPAVLAAAILASAGDVWNFPHHTKAPPGLLPWAASVLRNLYAELWVETEKALLIDWRDLAPTPAADDDGDDDTDGGAEL